MLPDDIDLPLVAAVALLVVAWLGYAPLLGWLAKGTLNNQLAAVRLRWIDLSTRRENRTFDAVLLGHIINSVAFFGSATLIVLAGLVGTLANVGAVHHIVGQLPFVQPTSLGLFAAKLLVVAVILSVSFFSFTYALRKLIYTLALFGSLPEGEQSRPELVETTATVLSKAVRSFNSGIRGFYYAVAALFLFAGAYPAIAVTLLVMILLFYRQTGTKTASAIGRHVDRLNR